MVPAVIAFLLLSTASSLAQTQIKSTPALKCPSPEDIDSLTTSDFSKTQFETTEEYGKRMLTGISAKFSTSNFVCKLTFAKFSYDADKSEVNFYSFDDVTIKKETIDNGSYVATNAFGARTTVLKQIEKLWQIKISDRPRLDKIKFKMQANTAKSNFDKLIAVVSGVANYPWYGVDKHTSKPTFSIPFETEYTIKYFYIKPTKLTIFNEVSGEVFFDEPLRVCKVYGMDESIFGNCKSAK